MLVDSISHAGQLCRGASTGKAVELVDWSDHMSPIGDSLLRCDVRVFAHAHRHFFHHIRRPIFRRNAGHHARRRGVVPIIRADARV